MSPPSEVSSSRVSRAVSALQRTWANSETMTTTTITQPQEPTPIPKISEERRRLSVRENSIDISSLLSTDIATLQHGHDTVLYLAYGSNLSAETFKGNRGIKPLGAVNVLVPALALTFDLPGVPYTEPCFANTRRRGPDEKPRNWSYHKERWHKGLVGVVYEVTKADYAIIIATEGGGASYQDITVDCFEIPASSKEVDPNPKTTPFTAHTLFCPQEQEGPPGDAPSDGGRMSRPDPNYAQASARYLKLITDGADEHGLPQEYRDWLYTLRPYTITSKRQRAGQILLSAVWLPIIFALFGLGRVLADERGRIPGWLAKLTSLAFRAMWILYDTFFKKFFGDGERTQERKKEDEEQRQLQLHIGEEKPLLQKEVGV